MRAADIAEFHGSRRIFRNPAYAHDLYGEGGLVPLKQQEI